MQWQIASMKWVMGVMVGVVDGISALVEFAR